MVLPGMAFGHVLRSPHAHARIRSIDASKAKAAPGVLAVLTGADWQASGWGDLPGARRIKRRDGSVFKPPYPALVKDRVRFVGDYVAFVVAESYHQALDAAELIAVDYEPLPACVSTAEATARWCARRSGTIAPTISASSSCSATRPRPKRPSPKPTMSSSIASSSIA